MKTRQYVLLVVLLVVIIALILWVALAIPR